MSGQRSPTADPAILLARDVASWPRGFDSLDALEGRWCVPCNGWARNVFVRNYFITVSRLGDGAAWVPILCAPLLAYGAAAWVQILVMAVTAWVLIVLNRLLKTKLIRHRPYVTYPEIEALAKPLDRNSFPSGHTMHAVAFVVLLADFLPGALWLVLPFAVSVAVSRVVLGLHYHSDVVAGAFLGWIVARGSLIAMSGLGL